MALTSFCTHGKPYKKLVLTFPCRTIYTRKADASSPLHNLRQAFAVNQLMAGMDIYDLSRHMGHLTVKMTEVYLDYVPGGAPVTRG